ncbi:hypothetical protein GA0070604_1760 [Micromonospora eburnea]|uniref:Uncharacterized protein n=1 Tax=Micromonospora eburnea TaxID=227316 RepID=A0A1C6U3U9_9ACTN|nr:hypothetical protein GA0070604_1760 [Micromonospora eburnea]
MKTMLRAVLSVALLIGFFVLTIGLVVGIGAVGLGYGTDWDGSGARTFRPLVVGVAIALLLVLVFTLGRVLTLRTSPPVGVQLTPERAPELWRCSRTRWGTSRGGFPHVRARPAVSATATHATLSCSSPKSAMSFKVPPRASM